MNDYTPIKTEELYRLKAEGRLSDKQAALLAKREKHEMDIKNPSLYWKYIKDQCIKCKNKMPKSWERYQVYGNFCSTCGSKIGKYEPPPKDYFNTGK
jgi:rRNA maturation endonuclease Nob1